MFCTTRNCYRATLHCLMASFVALLPCVACRGDERAHPNILLMVLDDVGYEDLASFGTLYDKGRLPQTPAIDALVKGGVAFDSTWATPLCTPTRAALQTGRHGFRTGMGTVGPGSLPTRELTLAEMLKLGTGDQYSTAAIGKWHLSADDTRAPNRSGYDHFSGPLGNIKDYYRYRRVVDGKRQLASGYATQHQGQDALRWIRSAREPWYCYLAFNGAHRPLHAPPPRMLAKPVGAQATQRDLYVAMIEAMDSSIGDLIEGIEPEILQRTFVILLSDNGTDAELSFNSIEIQSKGSVLEGGIHIPLVMAGPPIVRPGRRVKALAHVTDIFATIADVAGIELNGIRKETEGPVDSKSLSPYLLDTADPPVRTTVYTGTFSPNGFFSQRKSWHAIRDQRYKLIRFKEDGARPRDMLFDLLSTGGEANDLMSSEDSKSIGAIHSRLSSELESLLRQELPTTE